MFRTEVVKSKNLRRTTAFKWINAIAFVLLIGILLLTFNLLGADSPITRWMHKNYSSIVNPATLVLAVVIIAFSMVSSSMVRTPKRLGSLELDEEEFRYLEHDELKKSIPVSEITKISFEYFSGRNRGNPAGCMNYLTLVTRNATIEYEIEVGNSMEKAALGEVLSKINSKVPVTVKYANFVHKLLKDKDFKF